MAARSGWSSRHRIGVRCRCHLIAGVEVKVLAFVGASTRIPYNSEAIPHLAKDTQPHADWNPHRMVAKGGARPPAALSPVEQAVRIQ